ncbi:MAG TPA: hypothetical protein VND91_09645, partial [Candidatus Saccharimonadia bacterium]|nr:hypothetical protein [Candidatus Saccharimonadia bacterium]
VTTGSISNTGTGDSDQTGPDSTTLVTPVAGSPALDTTKAVTGNADGDSSGTITQGDVLTYTVTVTNTGNVPLTTVVVTDDRITPTGGSTPCASVAVGATCTLVGTYTVTAADVTAGSISNTGTGDSDQTDSDSAMLVTPVLGSPALDTTKAVTGNADGDSSGTVTQGDVLTYTVTVRNTGNVPLTTVVVSDNRITPTGGTTPCASVPVGGTCTLVGTYTVTAADVTAGSISNTGMGDSEQTGPDTTTLVTPVLGSPALDTTKAVTANADGDSSGNVSQGDVLTYTVTVRNTGDVALTNVVVTDNRITPTGGSTPCASVAVGAACTLVGNYTVTAADVTAGSISNTGTGDSDQTGPDSATLVTPVQGSPAINTAKALTSNADGDSSGTITQGDVLTYTITVSNTGNVPVNGVVVTDSLITPTGGTTPCATVAVGATCTLIGTYTVTAGDVSTGTITNTGTGDSAQTPPDSDTLVTPVSGSPALDTAKAVTSNADGDSSGSVTQGDVLTYTVTVTNTGNVPLTTVTVTDNRITPTGGTTPCASVAVGGTCTLVGTYTVTAGDVTTGSISNTGTGDSAQTPPDNVTLVTPTQGTPTLAVSKVGTPDNSVVAPSNQSNVGDRIAYTITVSNSGSGAATGVSVADARLPSLSCTIGGGAVTQPVTLAAGASLVCTGTYTLTGADVSNGSVANTATVTGTNVCNPTTPGSTCSDTETTPLALAPVLTATKVGTLDNTVVAPSNESNAGDRITYTITVANSGNGAATGVSVADARLPSLACTIGGSPVTMPATINAGASLVCTGSYTVSAGDVAIGSVTNSATVTGTNVCNPTTAGSTCSDTETTPLGVVPNLTVDKSHVGNFVQGQVGATYTIVVRNVGSAATSGTVTLTDTLPAGLTATAIAGSGWNCTLAPLSCTRGDALAAGASYPPIVLTVNVASNAPATLVNTATVSGGGDTTPGNNTDTDPTTVGDAGLPLTPDLTLTKSHTGTFVRGEAGSYTLVVSNVGAAPTAGPVTVVDMLPTGLSATALSGTGWTCNLATLTCTRSDALAGGGTWPAITLAVVVATNAPAEVTNTATVSGGSDTTPPNNIDTDLTPIGVSAPTPVPVDAPWALLLLAAAMLLVAGRRRRFAGR